MKVHGIGIIGYGGFGKFLHHSWKRLNNVKIIAASSKKQLREPVSDIKFYNEWKDLLKDEDVEIVSVATPPSSHCEIACAVMESGKHVLIEKPVAITLEEGKEILSTQRKTGKVASVNYIMRFNPIIEALGDLSKRKIFGELRRADIENYAQDSGLPQEHWFWDRSISGGILIEHAVHFIDIVESLTDQKFIKSTGLCHYRNIRQQDQVLASVLYDGGLIATHYHAFAYPGFFETTSVRLAFDLAVFDIQGWIPLKGQFTALVNSKTKKELSLLPGLTVNETESIHDIEDLSRPEGWGDTEPFQTYPENIFSHGTEYNVEEMVKGSFNIGKSKADIYSDCVCSILADLINKIDDKNNKLRVTVEDALLSLEIASLASLSAEKN